MSGVGFRKAEEMAARNRGVDAFEFEQERPFQSTERYDHDAAEAGIRLLVSQTERPKPLSRLQKRAPDKMQLKKQSPDSMGLCCRSPIPFLSPLVLSTLGTDVDRLLLSKEGGIQNLKEEERVVNAVIIPTNGWQHPAAPFVDERMCSFSHCFAELCIQDRYSCS